MQPDVLLGTSGTIIGPGLFVFTTSFSVAGSVENTSIVANQVVFDSIGVGATLTNTNLTMVGYGQWVRGNINLVNSFIENTGTFEDKTVDNLVGTGIAQFLNDAGARYEKTAATVGGGTSDFGASFLNWGTFELKGFTRNFLKGFTQYAGTVSLDGGTLGLGNTANSDYQLLGGRLLAQGGFIIDGDLINTSGTLDVSMDFGLRGNYIQLQGGTLSLEDDPFVDLLNGGPVMSVLGTAQICGTLEIDSSSGFEPESGTSYPILGTALGLQGAFTSTPAGWTVTYDGSNIALEKD